MYNSNKKSLRTELVYLRSNYVQELAHNKINVLAKQLAQQVEDNISIHTDSVVAGFWSMQYEIPTHTLLKSLHQKGIVVCLPVVKDSYHPMTFRQWYPEQKLAIGIRKIKIPPETAKIYLPDVVFVPLLAFDNRGHRLGYGRGDYDRTLAYLRQIKQITAIGLGFDMQEIDKIPSEPNDEPLDWIITPTKVIKV